MKYGLLFLFIYAAGAQQPDVIFRQNAAAGWVALGEGSELHGADGALVFNYDVAPKRFSGVVIGAPEGMARMGSLRFTIQSDHDTAMGVLLSEKKPGGGNYAAWFWAPKGVKQQIELSPADFSVTDGKGDPADADGKLDLDQVEGIGIFDLAQFFLTMAPNSELPITPTQEPGRHTARLEDFAVLTTAPAHGAQPGLVDGFDRSFLDWVAVGGMNVRLSPSGNPLGAPALEASYEQVQGQLGLLVRRVSNPALAKATRLSFDVASEHETTLMVALEMRRQGTAEEGRRFSVPIYPPGGKEVFHVDLSLADFKGPDGPFDPSQWKSIAIVDATGASGEAEGRNTIWIGRVEAK